MVDWQPIPGAVAALERLRARGVPFRIVTNHTTRSRLALHEQLAGLGFALNLEEIVTAPRAAAAWLRRHGAARIRLVVDEAVRDEFGGLSVVEDRPDVVVLGDVGDAWSNALLNGIFRDLMNGARLVALHKGRYWETAEGLTMDIGAFVAGLEYVSGVDATVVGKPSASFFELALDEMGAAPSESAMVGDDLINDVAGAQAAGMRGILVRTGKYRADVTSASDVKPDLTLNSIADVPDALLSL